MLGLLTAAHPRSLSRVTSISSSTTPALIESEPMSIGGQHIEMLGLVSESVTVYTVSVCQCDLLPALLCRPAADGTLGH